jgi:hypothetical protein
VNIPEVDNELIGMPVALFPSLYKALAENAFEIQGDTGVEPGDGFRRGIEY